MKQKTWELTVTCWQPRPRGSPSDFSTTLTVRARTSYTAAYRGLKLYLSKTHKRIGRATELDLKLKVLR